MDRTVDANKRSVGKGSLSGALRIKLCILRDVGHEVHGGTRIMDFGCGSGRSVEELRKLGYEAFGCDVSFEGPAETDSQPLADAGYIRLIHPEDYRLPFEDGSFDVVFSEQVFEHVQDYERAISEIARVLDPDGCSLHVFPSRYKPIESHVYVPFASIVQSKWWLHSWALLGIRNEHQEGLSARETARRNHEFLKRHTNYLSRRKIQENFRAHFQEVSFCEHVYLKASSRGKYVYSMSKVLPFLPDVYSTFRSRVLLTAKPH